MKRAIDEQLLAERELKSVSRLAHRMFTPKRFYKPAPIRAYKKPVRPAMKSDFNGGKCADCGRTRSFSSGRRCQECDGRLATENYEINVRAENLRIRRNEKAFQTVTKEITMSKKNVPVSPITRSTSGLRNTLFEEMEALRNGSSNAQRARSMAQMANAILQSVQVEIEYHKYVHANKNRVEGDQKIIPLGTDISLVA